MDVALIIDALIGTAKILGWFAAYAAAGLITQVLIRLFQGNSVNPRHEPETYFWSAAFGVFTPMIVIIATVIEWWDK
jgi:hypothetical protein